MDQYSYIKLVKQLTPPTPIQIDNFIEMLSWHHSWYKHLSNNRIHDFVIYLDPNAERTFQKISKKLVVDNDLTLKEVLYCDFVESDKDKERSKYTNAYGFWTYIVSDGLSMPVNLIKENEGRSGSKPYLSLNFVDELGVIKPIPNEIIEKCTIKLSKYLHRCYSLNWYNGFDNNGLPTNTIIQNHEEIIRDIKNHMVSILDMIYG